MKRIKKIYIDKVDEKFNFENSLALGPWCFDGIKEIDEVFSFYKKKYFITINYNKNFLLLSRKKFYKKNIIFFSKCIKKQNKLKDIHLKVITKFISPWVLFIHDIFYIYLQYIKYLKKNFGNKKIVIIKYYKPINLKPNSFYEFYLNSHKLNYFSSLIFFLLKKNHSKQWKFKCENYELKEKKKFNFFVILVKKIKIFFENFFFPNVIEVYSMNFIQKLILSKLLKKS